MNDERPLILLADDDPSIASTLAPFLERAGFHVLTVSDGAAAMDKVHSHRPALVVLDVLMPRMDGREVLAEIVADERLRYLPVVVLTTSAEEGEILNMYKLRCSSYIVKPVDFDKFVRVVQTLGDYWFTAVVLPSGRRPPASSGS